MLQTLIARLKPTHSFLSQRFSLINGSLYEYGCVFILLAIISVVLTNSIASNLNSQLFTQGIGDATSGFLYLIYADPDLDPRWAHSTLINYPYGQDLGSPIYITWLLVLGPLWVLSKIFSPIAALNLMMFIGFISAGIAMYAVVKRFAGNMLVSFFGAYAVAFSPYHIAKSSSHLTNLFNWVFVFIIGVFMSLWIKPSRLKAVLLGILIGAAWYTDGYYILSSLVLISALIIAAVFIDVLLKKSFKSICYKLKFILIAAGVGIITIVPIVITQITSGSEVSNDLANSRGSTIDEVRNYASKPIDFLLPPDKNPIASQFDTFNKLEQIKFSRSNPSESATYIGYTILFFAVIAVIYALKAPLRQRDEVDTKAYLVAIAIIACPLILVWMISPGIQIFGIDIRMPTYFIAEYLPLWRVPSRIFVALQPLVVLIASIGLYVTATRLGTKKKYLAYVIPVLAIVLLAIELYSPLNRPAFGLANMPKAYTWLKNQKDVTAVAELPMIDRPIEVSSYYVFAQLIHDKPLVNTALPRTKPGLFNPIGNLNNDEAVNFAKSRGANTIIAHQARCDQYGWGRLVYAEQNTPSPQLSGARLESTCIYRISDDNTPDNYFVRTKDGFQSTSFTSEDGRRGDGVVMESNKGTLRVVNSEGNELSQNNLVGLSFKLRHLTDRNNAQIAYKISQSGRTVKEGTATNLTNVSAQINSAADIDVEITSIDGIKNLPLNTIIFENIVIKNVQ